MHEASRDPCRTSSGIRRTGTVLYVVPCVLLTQHNQDDPVGSGDETRAVAAGCVRIVSAQNMQRDLGHSYRITYLYTSFPL